MLYFRPSALYSKSTAMASVPNRVWFRYPDQGALEGGGLELRLKPTSKLNPIRRIVSQNLDGYLTFLIISGILLLVG